VVIALVGLALVTVGASPQAGERTIYVSAVGGNGMPVIDPPIAPTEFAVSEDGAAREITAVSKASEPVYFAVLFETTQCVSSNDVKCLPDNNESNAQNFLTTLRDSLSAFCNVVLKADPANKIMLMDMGGAAVVKQDFTSNISDLDPTIKKLVTQRAEPVLNEALVAASNAIAKVPSKRRVILTINREPTVEASSVDPKLVASAVQKSGAHVWGLAVRYGSRQDGMRDQVLKGLANNSGGLRLTLGSPLQLGDYLTSVAANSIVQYAVTFKRPGDAPPAKITAVKITRDGVKPLTLLWSDK
jgi:hypothetical protein